jgi:hypothetical protein
MKTTNGQIAQVASHFLLVRRSEPSLGLFPDAKDSLSQKQNG